MKIEIKGARENNLKDIDVVIRDGLTAVTGISGSGKSSLVFDTLYYEARRRFLDQFYSSSRSIRFKPARVKSIKGLGPAIAVGQNLLNRNPNSTLATASGIHPLIRILYARFGLRSCQNCHNEVNLLSEDQIIDILIKESKHTKLEIYAQLVKSSVGSHATLIAFLIKEFGNNVYIDQKIWKEQKINSLQPHDIDIKISTLSKHNSTAEVREVIDIIKSLGTSFLKVKKNKHFQLYSLTNSCAECGTFLPDIEPKHFNQSCPHCRQNGCEKCSHTGLLPLVSDVKIADLTLPALLKLSVESLLKLFDSKNFISSSKSVLDQLNKRLSALKSVGLGYLALNRSSPTLSRGEAQRVRIALTLVSDLEDITYILDEPTIGQHPRDVQKFLPIFGNLKGPVIFVEHDKLAVSVADKVFDLGPEAGQFGGEIIFSGTPKELWDSETITGTFFSSREKLTPREPRPLPDEFIDVKGAQKHNLKNLDIKIPLHRITAITGVSGSGKSTLVEDVIYQSLNIQKPIGCQDLKAPKIKAIIVDQSPIGKNPRSNPATYTKIAGVFRKLFHKETGLSSSHFSFNRPEGACPTCKGMGAIEIKMKYLSSTWIPCSDCNQRRYKEEILDTKISFENFFLSIADLYEKSILDVYEMMKNEKRLSSGDFEKIITMLDTLVDIGLGYISLGQPSPSLSGGEAQRLKLAKFLGKSNLKNRVIILDEPSTGLHTHDIKNLLTIFEKLTEMGATILFVEHNTDMIKAADWIIDLGPDAGHQGGELIYSGKLSDFSKAKGNSYTFTALEEEPLICPSAIEKRGEIHKFIEIQNAQANNLKNISLKIPKNKITTVTGVSGSGKSSLVTDVIESEARRKFLETLSMYERQGTRGGVEAKAKSIFGLGITSSITPSQELYFTRFKLRNTIGRVTEISYHLSTMISFAGEMKCPQCGSSTSRRSLVFKCKDCKFTLRIPKPSHFHGSSYVGACIKCHGVGSLQEPRPEKLIVNPDKPLCKGAMYSPGFFPKGYLCKPYNGGYYMLQALAKYHNFDPFNTPWNEMSKEAQQEFLHGSKSKLKVTYENRKGKITQRTEKFPGFYEGYIRDWDIGGTYTESVPCPSCNGAKLKPEYLLIDIGGYNIHELSEFSLNQLLHFMRLLNLASENYLVQRSRDIIIKRLQFLIQTGLEYVNLNRIADSLSAGEAQRIRLAGLLGSELSSLTILLDEPSRGLHPMELEGLQNALKELRDVGNTIIMVEHDMQLIKKSDHIIDLGPKAGVNGGRIMAQGIPEEFQNKDTLTARWMRKELKFSFKHNKFKPDRWLEILGATEHNLKGNPIRIPHNALVGICGVSGSGKSTLIIDTLGRALSPRKQTTSVAYEPIIPGSYKNIKGKLPKTILIDQSKERVKRPIKFLNLDKKLFKFYANLEESQIKGITEKDLKKKCSACKGRGIIKTDMAFLPDIIDECEICEGTGFSPEAWEVQFKGYSLPDLNHLTFDEIFEIFNDQELITKKIDLIKRVGLGYLVLNQPIFSLSGGEVQRLKIVKELMKKSNKKTLYILDEPTVGLHLNDIFLLTKILRDLVENGHTVVVIEHHAQFLASCDWLIELGPVGGQKGGYVIAEGIPSELAKKNTPTAKYIKIVMEDGI